MSSYIVRNDTLTTENMTTVCFNGIRGFPKTDSAVMVIRTNSTCKLKVSVGLLDFKL